MAESPQAANDRLQAQGRRLLEAHRFEELFNEYGQYRIGGSFRYGLMVDVKPDIDGYIVTDDVTVDRALRLAGRLLKQYGATRVAVETETAVGKGVDSVALQVKVPFEDRKWNLDVHLIGPDDLASFDYLGGHGFSEPQRQTMLQLKFDLAARCLYPGSTKLAGSLSSLDVYRAVLEDGVVTADQAVEWSRSRRTAADSFRASQS